jgi:histidinol phosphatase-like enzyme
MSAEHAPVIFLDIDGVLNRTKAATHIRLDDDVSRAHAPAAVRPTSHPAAARTPRAARELD